jgi:uncharacterized protein (DUF2252 family)
LGKAARTRVPRESQAGWQPSVTRQDPVVLLQGQAETWAPGLAAIRFGRMAASPFAFYRGAAAIMAADLKDTPTSGLGAQLCGDAHVGNFGGFLSPDRDLFFDINDFDETLPGPWEWDVKRLAASLQIVGQQCACDAKECRALVLPAISAYRRAMQEFAALAAQNQRDHHALCAAIASGRITARSAGD